MKARTDAVVIANSNHIQATHKNININGFVIILIGWYNERKDLQLFFQLQIYRPYELIFIDFPGSH